MAMTISSPHERTKISGNEALAALFGTMNRLLAKFRIPSESKRRADEAIQILCNEDNGLDMRDWAERYLCANVRADAKSYLEGRRWQS